MVTEKKIPGSEIGKVEVATGLSQSGDDKPPGMRLRERILIDQNNFKRHRASVA